MLAAEKQEAYRVNWRTRFGFDPLADALAVPLAALVGVLLCLSAPCQVFSLAKVREMRLPDGSLPEVAGAQTASGRLTVEILRRSTSEGGPLGGVAEVVANVITARFSAGEPQGSYVGAIEEMLDDHGYDCAWFIADAADFGAYTKRNRSYLVFWRRGAAGEFPEQFLYDLRAEFKGAQRPIPLLPNDKIPEAFWASDDMPYDPRGQSFEREDGLIEVGRVGPRKPGVRPFSRDDLRETVYSRDGVLPVQKATGGGGCATGWIAVEREYGKMTARRLLPIESARLITAVAPEYCLTGDHVVDQERVGLMIAERFVTAVFTCLERQFASPPALSPATLGAGTAAAEEEDVGAPDFSCVDDPAGLVFAGGGARTTVREPWPQALVLQVNAAVNALVDDVDMEGTRGARRLSWRHFNDYLRGMGFQPLPLNWCQDDVALRQYVLLGFVAREVLLLKHSVAYALGMLSNVCEIHRRAAP